MAPIRKPNLIERIGLALGGGWLKEAFPTFAGDNIDPDEDLYRRITDSRRDLNPVSHERAQAISLHLWRSNPMAKRVVEMIVDFTVGANGLEIEAADDAVQELLDEFWSDPRSQWDLRHRDLVRDLSIYGELALRKFVNPNSGRMRVGVIDIARVKDVLPDPDDMMVDKTLVLANRGVDAGQTENVDLIVYDDITNPDGEYVGDAWFFAINRVIGQHRGTPDLFAIGDYVDGYDQLLFNALERTGLVNAFVWDVTLTGADETAVQKWLRDHPTAPPPGTVRVHNEREAWLPLSANLGNQDVVTIGREVKNMGLGGAGLPEAWFAQGDSANRATLAAQGDPTYRMLESRQKYVRSMFESILAVLIQANVGNRLPASVDTDFRIHMPDISSKDTTAIAAAMPQITTALVAAIGEELIDTPNARTIFLTIASQLGVELDPADVEKAVEEEKQKKDAEAQKRLNDFNNALGQDEANATQQPPQQPGQPTPPVPPNAKPQPTAE